MENTDPKGLADEIPVWCAFDEIALIEHAIPNPLNPNQHPIEQIELLAKIIQAQGWRAPITVSRRSGYIVKGHARKLAADLLGKREIPIDYQNYGSEAEEYADLVADNRIAELAEKNLDKMREIFLKLDGEIDLNLTGYGSDQIALITSDSIPDFSVAPENPGGPEDVGEEEPDEEPVEEDDTSATGEAFVIYVTFRSKASADTFLKELGREERFKANAKTLVVDMEP